MAKNTNNTQPPQSSQPSASGAASEHARLDWVLKSQSEISERLAVIETEASHTVKALERIEMLLEKQIDLQAKVLDKHCEGQEKLLDKHCANQTKEADKQNVEISKTNVEIGKINKKLAVAIASLVSGCIVITFIVNGQLGKISSFMEKQEIHVVQPSTTKKTP